MKEYVYGNGDIGSVYTRIIRIPLFIANIITALAFIIGVIMLMVYAFSNLDVVVAN